MMGEVMLMWEARPRGDWLTWHDLKLIATGYAVPSHNCTNPSHIEDVQ
jgi:hypothetical protein